MCVRVRECASIVDVIVFSSSPLFVGKVSSFNALHILNASIKSIHKFACGGGDFLR